MFSLLLENKIFTFEKSLIFSTQYFLLDDLSYRWLLNEFPVFITMDKRRFVSQTNGNLYIANVEASDKGNYSCFVSSPSITKSVFSKFIPLIPLPERKYFICYTLYFASLSAYSILIIVKRNIQWGIPWQLSGLRIRHCHCCGSGYSCDEGWIPGLGTSICLGFLGETLARQIENTNFENLGLSLAFPIVKTDIIKFP